MIAMLHVFLRDRAIPAIIRRSEINWTLADQAVVSGANFFTALIIARFLGIEAFGIFSIAWLILLFVQSFQIALILTPMLSIGPKGAHDQKMDYYASLLPLQLAFALLSATLAGLLCAYGGRLIGMGVAGGALAVPLALTVAASQLHEYGRRYCFSRTRPAAALRIDLIRYAAQFALLFYLYWGGHGTVANTLLAVAGSALLGLVTIIRQLPTRAWQTEQMRLTAGRHWNMAKWLVPSALMQWTSGNLFTMAAGALLGPFAVGAMKAIQNLMAVTHVLFQALDNWAPVRAARIFFECGEAALRAFVFRLMMFVGSGTALIIASLALPAEFWLNLLYGREYVPYGWAALVYSFAPLLSSINAPLRYIFAAQEITRPIFISYFAATVFSLIGAYPLISAFGLAGALGGIVGAQFMLTACFSLFYLKGRLHEDYGFLS